MRLLNLIRGLFEKQAAPQLTDYRDDYAHHLQLALDATRREQERQDAARAARTFSKAQCAIAAQKVAERGEAIYSSHAFRDLFKIDASVAAALWELGYSISPVPVHGGSGVRVSHV